MGKMLVHTHIVPVHGQSDIGNVWQCDCGKKFLYRFPRSPFDLRDWVNADWYPLRWWNFVTHYNIRKFG